MSNIRLHERSCEPINAELPILETPASIVDSCPTAMLAASGGQYAKRDKIHLDRNRGNETHESIVGVKDIFDADKIVRGLGGYLASRVEQITAPAAPAAPAEPAAPAAPAAPAE